MLTCRDCNGEHPKPASRTWSAVTGTGRAADGGAAYLVVEPGDGRHVAYEDADWLTELLAAIAAAPEAHEAPGQFAAWLVGVYEPAVATIAAAFREAVPAAGEATADQFARACLARLLAHEPPLSVEVLKP